jgi:glycosyltransferase involved in cell wall biosynthesis
MVKIAVINSHPIQYFAPLYKELNNSHGIEITSLYLSDLNLKPSIDPGFKREITWDVDMLEGYNYKFIGKYKKNKPNGFLSLIAPEIWTEIRSSDYDVIWLHGYNFAAYLVAFLAAKSKGIKIFFRGESHLELTRGWLNSIIHETFCKIFFRYIDAFLAIGTANKEYYKSFGIDESNIFLVPYTIDNSRFTINKDLMSHELDKLRADIGLSNNPTIIFASKFMARKRPQDLLEAARILQKEGLGFNILFVGSGDLEKILHDLVAKYNLKNIFFKGFVNQTSLPLIYAASDIFVLPSIDEPWGLVINEVMSCGLPIIIAKGIGAANDLVREGENGFTFEPLNPIDLSSKLKAMLEDSSLRAKMSKNSVNIINSWTYKECVMGVKKACKNIELC